MFEVDIDKFMKLLLSLQGIKCTFIVYVIAKPTINETRVIRDKGIICCDHNICIIKIGKESNGKK